MKDFKNDSDTTLARFGRDKRARISSAERIERRPRLQRDAADSEHSSDSRPRASYNPNFTSDNRPVREDRAHRDDSRRFGNRSFGSDDRRRNDAADREFKPRFSERKDGYASRPYEDNKPGGFKKFGKPYGEQKEGRDRSFGDRKSGGYSRSDKPYGERRYDDRKQDGYKTFDKPYGERRSDDRKSGGFRGGDRSFGRRDDKFRSYPRYNPNKPTGEIRLNRFIAQSGICSRREADDFIQAGLVTVNGVVVTTLGTKVQPTDEVKFNDSRVEGEKKVYLVLNKPKGYVTSLDDPHAGKTVMDLVEGACTERIYPVGRLDKNSLGLLLFTNDGDLTKQLTHPSYLKKKIYQVTLDKPLARADMDRIAEGITLEDGEIFADEISYVKENKQEIGIEIHSGRNRIVRRIFEFLGYTVTKLDRVYYAGLTKKNLKRGAWRFLSREEVERLKSGQYE